MKIDELANYAYCITVWWKLYTGDMTEPRWFENENEELIVNGNINKTMINNFFCPELTMSIWMTYGSNKTRWNVIQSKTVLQTKFRCIILSWMVMSNGYPGHGVIYCWIIFFGNTWKVKCTLTINTCLLYTSRCV